METDDSNSVEDIAEEHVDTRNCAVGGDASNYCFDVPTKEKLLFNNTDCNSSKFQSTSCPTTVVDLPTAEQQFLILKAWVSNLDEEQCKNDLLPILMPLVCHLYCESLRTIYRPSSITFLKRHYPSVVTAEWLPLLEKLLSISTVLHIPQFHVVREFRNCKIQIKISSRSITLLRKFLTSKNLHILIAVFQTWFNFIPVLDDDLSSDENMSNTGFTDSDDESDEEMEELLNVICGKNDEPLPLPPLRLFKPQNIERMVCATASSDYTLAAIGNDVSEVHILSLSEPKLKPRDIAECVAHDRPQLKKDNNESKRGSKKSNAENSSLFSTIFQILNSNQKEKQSWTLHGHCGTVQDVAFVSNVDYLLSVSFDASMRLWKLDDFSCAAVYRGHSSPIWTVGVCPVSNFVATGSHDRTAKLWSLDRTFPVRIMVGHTQDVTCVAFHPNGNYMATGSPDRTVRLWSVNDGQLVRVMGATLGQGPVHSLAFSPNGKLVASAGSDDKVWVWDISEGELYQQLTGHNTNIVAVDWSKDGSGIAAAGQDGKIIQWPLDNKDTIVADKPCESYNTKCLIYSLQYSYLNSLIAIGAPSETNS